LVVQLGSTFPNHDRFERRLAAGEWHPASAFDVLPVGACFVEYRSLDALGNASAVARLNVWVPRAGSFIERGSLGGIRRQAEYCS
jgi:hypothetical protein